MNPNSAKLSAVYAIALNTFRETVRDRVLYAFVLFALIVAVLGLILGSLSIGQDVRLIEDIGLAAIAIIGGIIAVFAGTNLVYKELERRTIYIIFSKPLTGWQFILGKYLGLSLCVLVVVAAMSLFLLALVMYGSSGLQQAPVTQMGWHLVFAILGSVALVYMELLLVIALATFFSTFATPIMSVLFTLGLWLIGHLSSSLRDLGHLSQNALVQGTAEGVYWVLPDLAGLTKARGYLIYGQAPDPQVISYLLCYVFAYVLMLLVASALVTDQREFP